MIDVKGSVLPGSAIASDGVESDEEGRMVAVRLRPRQFTTLANGVLGLAAALD